ncbi:uncharacterized protein EDB91DRAFT_1177986 [Suillus paluster]|uniref:uncharacterized protein n=1 Tax=Suillus paluster TaxID=48578 RepID=UPI001B87E1F6|nr:uncharacterized protein EDB91DRAFT_1177986 [Suillus paluster]KAG1720503.1 hypothetical protein EDB91DRAFT_1177986 [Suillus paluster]
MRTMVAHGLYDQLSPPDNEKLIWDGDLRWCCSDTQWDSWPGCEEFDWVVDYLANDNLKRDDKTEGDALLVLSAMRGLGSSSKRPSYIKALIRCMHPTKPPRVRHAAFRAVFDAREELASITTDPTWVRQGVDAKLLNQLSCALLTAVWPNHDQTVHGSAPDATLHKNRDRRYIQLMFTLTEHDEWCQHLTRDDHLGRCISLVDEACNRNWNVMHYLPVIFGRINISPGKDFPFSPAQENWRKVLQKTWQQFNAGDQWWKNDYADTILALVTTTKLNLRGSDDSVLRKWFAELATEVDQAIGNLQSQADDVNGVAQDTVNTAISRAQELRDDLMNHHKGTADL